MFNDESRQRMYDSARAQKFHRGVAECPQTDDRSRGGERLALIGLSYSPQRQKLPLFLPQQVEP
jgi:hypothetical protein